MARGIRVLAYSHDGYGLGHLRRNLRIVTGLAARRRGVDAALVTGASGAETFVCGSGVRCFQLPAVVKVANGCYVPESGFDAGDVLAVRKGLIEEAFRFHRPDLVLVDRYPLGMKGELEPALERLRAEAPHVPVVLGLRDIIDEPATVQAEWQAGGYTEAIRHYYRSVFIYGDPQVFNPLAEYPVMAEIASLVSFTGYLTDDVVADQAAEIRQSVVGPDERLAVCTLGGGRDALPVAEAFLGAVGELHADGWRGCLITGPYMTAPDVSALESHPGAAHTLLMPMVANVPDYLAAADAVVCMGGYNTMCEVLATGAAAVVVPRVRPRREQIMRSSLFAELGLLRSVEPAPLTPSQLAAEIRRVAADVAARRPLREVIRHAGIERTTELLQSLLPVRVA